MINTAKLRRHNGATLALTVVTLFVLTIVATGLFFLALNLGGHREGTHATDAGTLNVAKKSVLVRADGDTQENAIYGSVSENGHYSLRSINRVWGHGLLTMMNARSMRATGHSSATSDQNEIRAFNAADSISAKLAQALNNQNNLEGYFAETGFSNSLRMLDANGSMTSVHSWETACDNRGGESNIRIYGPQMPPAVSLADLASNPVAGMPDGGAYLRGYYPLNLGNGKYVNFVPFEYEQKPHLISQTEIETHTLGANPYPQWRTPVPNSFKCTARASDQIQRSHTWNSAAIANTMDKLDLEVPNGFVRITLEQDQWKWFPNFVPGVPLFTENVPKSKVSLSHAWIDLLWFGFPPAFFTAKGQYGHQYYDAVGHRTLHQAIYAYGNEANGMYSEFNQLLFNRINQIKPKTSWAEIMQLLKNKQINGAGDSFIIGRSRTGSLMVANVATSDRAQLDPYVNIGASADGSTFDEVKQVTFSKNNVSPVVHLTPKWVFGILIYVPKLIKGGTVWRHKVSCTPGTGVNGAMLDVRQKDTVYAFWGAIGSPVSDGGMPVTTASGCGCS